MFDLVFILIVLLKLLHLSVMGNSVSLLCLMKIVFCATEMSPSSYLVSEIEESMLSALRPPEHTPVPHRAPLTSDGFSSANHSRLPADPSELPPDRLHVEMEMSPDSQILLYGPLLRALVAIKVQICCLVFSYDLSLSLSLSGRKYDTEAEFLNSCFCFCAGKLLWRG